jgi:hypothetical protein
MQEFISRFDGVGLGLGAGLGWGWISGRVFRRSLVQDLSAMLIGALLGCIVVVGAAIANLAFSSSSGGVGAVSAGVSEVVLIVLPVVVVLAIVSRVIRRRLQSVTAVPIVLGGLSALLGALWVVATISS